MLEGVYVQNNHCGALAPFGVGHQSRRIHRHKEIAVVARGIDFGIAYVDLKSGHARNNSVRGPDFCRIVGKGRETVAYAGGGVSKKRPGELHTVT